MSLKYRSLSTASRTRARLDPAAIPSPVRSRVMLTRGNEPKSEKKTKNLRLLNKPADERIKPQKNKMAEASEK